MATPIDFTKFAMNRIKKDKIIRVDLVRPVYKLLKGTCKSSIELEYNMDQCYNALTDQLDWTNPEGDRFPYDLSKPLHLQGSPGYLTIPVDFFFNNDLEYLKTGNSERKYTNKLFNLSGDDIVNLVIALHMFTRSLVIKKRVENVQLGVESYQKKLNFSDGTLKSVHEILHYRLLNFELGYNKDMPKRKWTDKDQHRTDIMVKKIDNQLLERLIMRSLEGLVGGRNVETDYRLLQQTV
ncbi:hypothetical protein Tco_0570352 [Tanacetum coccineum]